MEPDWVCGQTRGNRYRQDLSATVTASPVSDKVAIVWIAPEENNVWYAVSGNQGGDWIAGTGNGSIGHEVVLGTAPGANITQYASGSKYKAHGDLAVLITSDDYLHIVWNCRQWINSYEAYNRKSAIFHWSEDVPFMRTITRADWALESACSVSDQDCDVCKMTISECDGRLYVLYTQFDNAANPCYDVDARTICSTESCTWPPRATAG